MTAIHGDHIHSRFNRVLVVPEMNNDVNRINELIGLLEGQLARRQSGGWAKLAQGLTELQESFSSQRFFYLFAICPRWFDKSGNAIDPNEAGKWGGHDPHGALGGWQYPQLARLLILLRISRCLSRDDYVENINALYKTADVNELVLMGQSLAFIPDAGLFIDRARESARSNIVTVFSSIAHDNDYPKRFFDQAAWNQLVLKAAFLAVPIWSIDGLRERNNPDLAVMLRHYVSERQAAKRSVPWDLWCCIGWLAQSEEELEYLRQQWQSAQMKTQAAITLALSENPSKTAQATAGMLSLPAHPVTELNWPRLAGWPD